MTHHYVPASAAVEWPSDPPCADCQMPEGAQVHAVKKLDPEVAVIDARKLGELERPDEVADG